MNWETITLEKEGNIAIVTINRPQSRNALNTQLAKDLIDVFEKLAIDEQIWVVLLTGNGDKAFCAGADLKERATMTAEDQAKQREIFLKSFRTIDAFPKPLIAAVNGVAIGGGLLIALHCDIIYASENAILSIPEVKLGLVGVTVNLPRIVGKSRAKEMLFTGRPIYTEEALQWGIISKVFPGDKLLEEAKSLCHEINKNAPFAVRQAKKCIDFGMEVDLNTAFAWEVECYNNCLKSEDRVEGIRAYNEKRAPEFKGR